MRGTIPVFLLTLIVAASSACSRSAATTASSAPLVCATPLSAVDNAARPQTIPALREWQPSAATAAYQYGPTSRIVLAPDSKTLRPVAQVLAEDLQMLSGKSPAIVTGTPRAGDISLSLGNCDARLGLEGYALAIGPAFEIQASTADGVFYGTRSVLQLLHQGNSVVAGLAMDWPRYPERGLMVDAGRKYFTPDWFKQHIRDLAYLKLNYLHLHFSDNEGWRIESEKHPEIVTAPNLSKAEVRELIALAARYHIMVVPEIDMPGHMGAALAPHPEFQLTDSDGNKAPRNLDVSNPAAVKYAHELIEEYLPLFPARYWHSGGEEYLPSQDYSKYPQLQSHAQTEYGPSANATDAVLGFINDTIDLVHSKGKTDRIWHDGLSGGSAVTVRKNIVVEWWTDFNPLGNLTPPSPQQLLDQGYTISNSSYWPLYYTVGSAAGFPPGLPPRPDLCSFYQGWSVNMFVGPLNAPAVACNTVHVLPPTIIAEDEPRNLGSKVLEWNDGADAETQEQIADGIAPRLRILAQKTWNSPLLVQGYADFESVINAIGHAPGYSSK